MLRLDFAYARVSNSVNGSPLEALRLAQRQTPLIQPQLIGLALEPWLTTDTLSASFVIPNPIGTGKVSVAPFRLGFDNEIGMVVAASQRSDFPTRIETLLLRVAANQAAVGLQEARILSEQKRTAAELEQKVDERTAQVRIAVEELGKQINQREQAEEEQQKLAALVEHSPDFIGIASLEGQVLFLNPAGQKMVGLDGDEQVMLTRIFDYIMEEELERFKNHVLPTVVRHGKWEGEINIRHFKTGKPIPMLHHLFYIKDEATNRRLALATISRDITERKRAEEKLAEANETIEMVLNSITDRFFALDHEWRYTYFNKQAEEQLKSLNKNPETLIGKVMWDEFPHPPIEQAFRTAMKERTVITNEHYYPPLNEWVENRIFPTPDGGLAIYQRYITDRKKTEQELNVLRDELASELEAMTRLHDFSMERASIELQPFLEEVLDATIALQNADFGNIQLYNPETQTLEIVAQHGFQKDFLDYFRVVREDSSACGRARQQQKRVIIEDVLTDPGFAPHRPIAAASGFRAVQSTPLTGSDGRPLGIISTHFRRPHRPSQRDLRFTDLYARQAVEMIERRRAQEKLQRSETYLAEGQRLSHTGSWVFNVSTAALFWSDEHFRIFGLDPEAVEPSYPLFLQSVHSEDRATVNEVFYKAVRGKSDYQFAYRIVRPDATIRHIHSLAHPVFNAENELFEYVGTIVDITEPKLYEEALRQAHTELAHVSRVLTMGELTSSIAHEVNQPLAAIVTNGNACLHLLSREQPDVAEVREAVDCMISDSLRAGEVIKRIRALLKKSPAERLPIDLNEAVQEVVGLASAELDKNRVSVRTHLETDLPKVIGDRVQLQQVVLNLILNGNEAMSGKGWQPRELVISSHLVKPEEITVVVSDSGPGIDPQNTEQIFDAFFTTKESGLGLGLSISRTIVEAHGGKLWASSNKDRGTSFQFSISTSDGHN
jgi:PAS domain S-box-containing protein